MPLRWHRRPDQENREQPVDLRRRLVPSLVAESCGELFGHSHCKRWLNGGACGDRKVQRWGWGWNLLRRVSCSKDQSVGPSMPRCWDSSQTKKPGVRFPGGEWVAPQSAVIRDRRVAAVEVVPRPPCHGVSAVIPGEQPPR
jgi:hypothetical protein